MKEKRKFIFIFFIAFFSTIVLTSMTKIAKETHILYATSSMIRELDGAKNLIVYDGSSVQSGSKKYSLKFRTNGKVSAKGNDIEYANLDLCDMHLEPGNYSLVAEFEGEIGPTVVKLWWIEEDGTCGSWPCTPLNESGERNFEVKEPCRVRAAVQAENGYTNCTVRPALFKND